MCTVYRLNKIYKDFYLVFLAVTILGTALRLPNLAQRPMHTDEAIHAIKFGYLLENNDYRYDPYEYHGPTLNYSSLIPTWLISAQKITDVSETTLRLVPVIFGILLVLILLLLRNALSRSVVLWAGLLTAVSPAMVFYSRYYIHEMLLITFTFGAIASGFRYFQSKQLSWSLCTGVFVGLMHATKETCIIAFAAMVLSLFLVHLQEKDGRPKSFIKINFWHLLSFFAIAFTFSAIFYSSFFTNPQGIFDSFLTYKTYLNRAGHNDWHIHPWYYYFELLIFNKYSSRPLWSEAFIVILAGIGFVISVKKKSTVRNTSNLLRLIAFYTLIMAVIYSAIPYKTPWSMLGLFHGMILLAAVAVVSIYRMISKRYVRTLFVVFIVAGTSHLFIQCYLSNFKFEADPSNPYVYAHTSRDVFDIVKRVEKIAECHPKGKEMVIEVICPGSDYWPLPWYLRSFPNIGWWNEVNFSFPAAPVILAFPSVECDILRKLYDLPPPGEKNLYVPLLETYTELRPQIEIRGYVIKDLWDIYMQRQL
jgi:uncharacterized protein (TIGR03663 family)